MVIKYLRSGSRKSYNKPCDVTGQGTGAEFVFESRTELDRLIGKYRLNRAANVMVKVMKGELATHLPVNPVLLLKQGLNVVSIIPAADSQIRMKVAPLDLYSALTNKVVTEELPDLEIMQDCFASDRAELESVMTDRAVDTRNDKKAETDLSIEITLSEMMRMRLSDLTVRSVQDRLLALVPQAHEIYR